ncbi:hypothetical protein QBC39DRAFT_362857 [Podospora conica]|nr:hypothetical protein QBC39DRAFT_362857 [Schizothecium conicum]
MGADEGREERVGGVEASGARLLFPPLACKLPQQRPSRSWPSNAARSTDTHAEKYHCHCHCHPVEAFPQPHAVPQVARSQATGLAGLLKLPHTKGTDRVYLACLSERHCHCQPTPSGKTLQQSGRIYSSFGFLSVPRSPARWKDMDDSRELRAGSLERQPTQGDCFCQPAARVGSAMIDSASRRVTQFDWQRSKGARWPARKASYRIPPSEATAVLSVCC